MNSNTIEKMLMLHKPKCENNDITTITTSGESHVQCKKHKNPFYSRICAHFEADNEIDNSSIGNKTTKIYKQKPGLKGYRIVSEFEDVLKNGYYEFPLGYDNVDWFVNEVIKLESKMAYQFEKKTKKNSIMTEKDEEDFKNKNICRFCEKKI